MSSGLGNFKVKKEKFKVGGGKIAKGAVDG